MERDDIIEYSLDNHHSEEEGKVVRKKIWKVTFILTLITVIEVVFGALVPKSEFYAADWWIWVKIFYIVLTVGKAAFIVKVFMHLGDERKAFKMFVLAPYLIFICYLIWLVFTEAEAVKSIWTTLFV